MALLGTVSKYKIYFSLSGIYSNKLHSTVPGKKLKFTTFSKKKKKKKKIQMNTF